jgi:hypothetical protein
MRAVTSDRAATYLLSRAHALATGFRETIPFVEPCAANRSTFSARYAELLRGAGAAFSSFMSSISRAERPDIRDFRTALLNQDPRLPQRSVRLGSRWKPEAANLWPFAEMTAEKSPAWWNPYNNLKHHEVDSHADANLENVLNAVGGIELVVYAFGERGGSGSGLFQNVGIIYPAGDPSLKDLMFPAPSG